MSDNVIPLHRLRPANRRFTDIRHLALTVECPWCAAGPGEPCTYADLTGQRHPSNAPAHPARITAAESEDRSL